MEELVGKVFDSVKQEENAFSEDAIVFYEEGKKKFSLHHEQECCEYVDINDIVGDLNDLENTPILEAYKETNSDSEKSKYYDESWTWTFFRIVTIKGTVTIKFYGTSNGYYSEDADLYEVGREERKQ